MSHYRTFPWTSYYDRGGRTNAWSSNTIKLHLWNWTKKWLKKYGFLIPSSLKKSAPKSTQWQSLTVCFTFTKMALLFTVWGWINVKFLNKIRVNLENHKLKTINFLVVSYRKIWIHWAVCHIIRFVFTPTSKSKFYYLTVAPIIEKSLSQDWNDLVVWNGVTKLSFGPAVVSNDDRKLWVYTAVFFFFFLGSLDICSTWQ